MASAPQNLLLALTIGAEVFAIAALWPLSDWATSARRRVWYVYAVCVVVACIVLEAHGLVFPAMRHSSPNWAVARSIQWATLPLFISFPDAACVAVGQSLTRAGLSARTARAAALGVSALAVIVAPFAALIAGCGLAGACV